MHELPITENIRNIAIKHAQQAGALKITDIYLVIGQFSSVVDDSVQFYWSMISEGTIAENARLHFKRIPAEMSCEECNCIFHPNQREFSCPECGSTKVRLLKGNEFYMEAIDVENTSDRRENNQEV